MDKVPFTELPHERHVPCYCGKTLVVTRRPERFDRYAVCSRECFDKMKYDDPSVLYKITGELGG